MNTHSWLSPPGPAELLLDGNSRVSCSFTNRDRWETTKKYFLQKNSLELFSFIDMGCIDSPFLFIFSLHQLTELTKKFILVATASLKWVLERQLQKIHSKSANSSSAFGCLHATESSETSVCTRLALSQSVTLAQGVETASSGERIESDWPIPPSCQVPVMRWPPSADHEAASSGQPLHSSLPVSDNCVRP